MLAESPVISLETWDFPAQAPVTNPRPVVAGTRPFQTLIMCSVFTPVGSRKNVSHNYKPIYYIWARPWENVSYAICEQQRCRSACASAQSDQRLCCSLPRQNDTSSLYIQNFKILAGRCSWAGQFGSCQVGDSQRHIFSWPGSYLYYWHKVKHI